MDWTVSDLFQVGHSRSGALQVHRFHILQRSTRWIYFCCRFWDEMSHSNYFFQSVKLSFLFLFLLKMLVSHHSGVWLKQCDLFSACKVCSPCFCDFVGSLFHTLHQCVCLGSGWRTPWKKMTRPVFYSSWLAPKRISVWVTIMKNPWIETEIEVQVIHNSCRIYFSRIIFLANP